MTEQEVSDVLLNIVTDENDSLARGLRDRQRIAAALDRGQEPIGHRVEWLRDTAYALNDTLMAQAAKFKLEHPGDRISVHDMVDALAMMQAQLIKMCKTLGEK